MFASSATAADGHFRDTTEVYLFRLPAVFGTKVADRGEHSPRQPLTDQPRSPYHPPEQRRVPQNVFHKLEGRMSERTETVFLGFSEVFGCGHSSTAFFPRAVFMAPPFFRETGRRLEPPGVEMPGIEPGSPPCAVAPYGGSKPFIPSLKAYIRCSDSLATFSATIPGRR